MSDPAPTPSDPKHDKRTFLRKLAEFLHPGPDSAEELIQTLAEAEYNQIIGPEARAMLEGVIRLADIVAPDHQDVGLAFGHGCLLVVEWG